MRTDWITAVAQRSRDLDDLEAMGLAPPEVDDEHRALLDEHRALLADMRERRAAVMLSRRTAEAERSIRRGTATEAELRFLAEREEEQARADAALQSRLRAARLRADAARERDARVRARR